MDMLEAREEYIQARRLAQKEIRELRAVGKETVPEVLEEIIGENYTGSIIDLGVVNVATDRIVGTKTAGRITAFSPSFMPNIFRGYPEKKLIISSMSSLSAYMDAS